jgi:hypothetical protein
MSGKSCHRLDHGPEVCSSAPCPTGCLHQLRRHPLCSRMFGHVEMHHPSAFMSQNEENIQDSETHGRHHEEIHRYQLLYVVLQERPPRLRWRLEVLHHVLGNRCLRYLDSELQQFPVSRSHNRSRTRLRLLRWRTASWCRSARISNWSEARVRSVKVNPASRDISTAHMAHDGISVELQVQHFQLLWSFQ